MTDIAKSDWPLLKVLHIIITANKEYGGPVEGLIQSIKFRQNNNQYIEIVTLDDPKAEYLKEFPCKVNGVGPVHPKFGYSSKIKNWIIENGSRFDAAVIHGLWNPSSIEGWQGCKTIGLPYVVFTHGMLDPWFRKAYPFKYLIKQLYWILQGRVLQNAYSVLFTSSEEEKLAKGVFWGYHYQPKVVAYAAADAIKNSKTGMNQFNELLPNVAGKPYLLYLSRIHEKKGCDLLIRAFAAVIKRSDLQLVMAGPCHDNYIIQLKNIVEQLGIQDKIHWSGMLKGEIKAAAFMGAEAFVLTSHQENFGIAVAEALAYGRPVLISDQINIWREIEAGNGGIVGCDTIDGATQILQRWESLNTDQRLEMGRCARQVYENNFTVQAAAKDLTDTLIDAISNSRSEKSVRTG